MKLPSVRLLATAGSLGILVLAAACGGKDTPLAPTSTTPPPPAPVVAASVTKPALASPIASQQVDSTRPTLKVTNATVTGNAGDVKYRFEISEKDTFPADDRFTVVGNDVDQASSETSWQPEKDLQPNFTYYWRARAKAANVTDPTEWTSTEKFITANIGHCLPGPDIYDPLTNGRSTCGSVIGGTFMGLQGWQATKDTDGINFDIPTCSNCTVEFDVTNFGKKEGEHYAKDLKWLSMGDASSFRDFVAFRNDPWKMHLEQRGDGDGSGMKLIWRNGDAGDGEPGDHTAKVDPGIDWRGNVVYHFIVSWFGGNGYRIQIGEKQSDGTVTNLKTWFQDGFGGHAYAPGNHRIQLGCSPRGETFFNSAIWRNVKIYKN